MNQSLQKSHRWLLHMLAAGCALLFIGSVQAQPFQGLTASSPGNLLSNGGFEAPTPAFWSPNGAGAVWSSERSRTPNYSLALNGAGAASWDMPEAILKWVPRFPGNVELTVGAYVQTEGVNTAPAGDDAKFQLVFNFYNAGGTNLLGGELAIDLPQDAASTTGWVEIDNTALGVLTLPEDATHATIEFRKGANATGSAWLDDLFIRTPSAEWPGDIHNANLDAGDTWYYYWDGFPRAEDNWPAEQPFIVSQTTAEAHTGAASQEIAFNFEQGGEAVAISDRVPATEGEPMLVSFWVKTDDVAEPELIGTGPERNIGLTALFYSSLESGAAGYNEIGGLDIRLNGEYNPGVIPLLPQVASADWTQYAFVVYPQEGAVGMEVRLRMWREFSGTAYWDDVFIAPVSEVVTELPNLLSNGGFEAPTPAFWTPSGAGAVWSSERSRTPNYSLALNGAGAASWDMPEAILKWVPRFPGNVELTVGAYIQTEGVNTAPAGDDAKFQLVFNFYNAGGTNLLGGELAIDLPQDAASTTGWVEIDNTALGVLTLPEDATHATIEFRKGANATGSAWLDDLFIRTPSAEWPGDIHNANLDAGDTWYYYWDGFPRAEDNWPAEQPFIVSQTTAEAHTGAASQEIAFNFEQGGEAVAISDRVPATEGEPMLVSFWVKTDDVAEPELIGTGPERNIGLTALFYSSLESGAAGYNEIGGLDIRLNGEYNPGVIPLLPQVASADWTQYAFVVYPQEGAVGMEVRLRMWREFSGTAYFDDVTITPIAGGALATAGEEDRRPCRT